MQDFASTIAVVPCRRHEHVGVVDARELESRLRRGIALYPMIHEEIRVAASDASLFAWRCLIEAKYPLNAFAIRLGIVIGLEALACARQAAGDGTIEVHALVGMQIGQIENREQNRRENGSQRQPGGDIPRGREAVRNDCTQDGDGRQHENEVSIRIIDICVDSDGDGDGKEDRKGNQAYLLRARPQRQSPDAAERQGCTGPQADEDILRQGDGKPDRQVASRDVLGEKLLSVEEQRSRPCKMGRLERRMQRPHEWRPQGPRPEREHYRVRDRRRREAPDRDASEFAAAVYIRSRPPRRQERRSPRDPQVSEQECTAYAYREGQPDRDPGQRNGAAAYSWDLARRDDDGRERPDVERGERDVLRIVEPVPIPFRDESDEEGGEKAGALAAKQSSKPVGADDASNGEGGVYQMPRLIQVEWGDSCRRLGDEIEESAVQVQVLELERRMVTEEAGVEGDDAIAIHPLDIFVPRRPVVAKRPEGDDREYSKEDA